MDNAHLETLGWREWVSLPDLGIDCIKAKVDTGARTSCLHAFYVEPFSQDGRQRLRFGVHPKQGNTDVEVHCEADVLDLRDVTDSGGHREQRYVIESRVVVAGRPERIELTLTDRDSMRFRMLLGRKALAGRYLVDVRSSYLTGKPPKFLRTPK